MLNLEEVKKLLIKGKSMENLLEKSDWKNFETIIADIFKENGFSTKLNFRFKTKNRSEIDVIAARGGIVFCVDCKWWGRGRHKKSGLKYAVDKQEKRLEEFKKFIKANPLAMKMLKISPKSNFHPLVVTLFEEELLRENKTLVVPAWKLNHFLLEMENYIS